MNEKELFLIAGKEAVRIFGKTYLQDNIENMCTAHGIMRDGTFHFFIGIKGNKDLSGREATVDGWVVYAQFLLNANTGEFIKKEYNLE